MTIHSPRTVGLVSLGIFAVALTQDGFYLDRVGRDAWAPGWGEFALGWISLFSGTVAWLGNPLLIASWITLFRGKIKWAAGLAFVALLFMLSFLLNKRIVDSEAGTSARISGYGLGYWLWLSSAFVVVFGTVLILSARSKAAPRPNQSSGPALSSGEPVAGQE
jgi:hypothetical protein